MGTRPIVTDTSSPAGEAFNQTLRAIASLPQHHSQLFGWKEFVVNSIKADADEGLVWDSKFFGFREGGAENATNEHALGETLIWVINWQSPLVPEDELLGLLKEKQMGNFFRIPQGEESGPKNIRSDSPLQTLSVKWEGGNPERLLSRTKRPMELWLSSKSESVSAADREYSATGSLVSPTPQETKTRTEANLRSIDPEANYSESQSGCLLFRTSLTRTRWCTRIREDLMASILARRVD